MTRCTYCGRRIRGRSGVIYPICASCADADGPWEPAHWRDAVELWAWVIVGCGLWALGLWLVLS